MSNKTTYKSVGEIPSAAAREAFQVFYDMVLNMVSVLRCSPKTPTTSKVPDEIEVVAEPDQSYLDDGNTRTPGTTYRLCATFGLDGHAAPSPRDLHMGAHTLPGLCFFAELTIREVDQTIKGHRSCSAYVVKFRDTQRMSRFMLSTHSFDVLPTRLGWVQAVRDLTEAAADIAALDIIDQIMAPGYIDSPTKFRP